MGTFVFTWSQPASEVYVTGTFDDWKKTAKLDKENGIFSRQVDIPAADKPIYYKFVVDGVWTVDNSKPLETDDSGNVNNLLKPAEISPIPAGGRSQHGQHPAPVSAALLSSVGPTASTVAMAGQVPPEKSAAAGDDAMPGDRADKTFSVNPLPATAGTGNPVNLKPGEPVPASSSITSNTLQSNVRTDKASYEKSDAYPAGEQKTLDTKDGAFGVPPVSGTMIPESSLPMGAGATSGDSGPFIQSAGAGTTTAALAGQVPQEPRKDAEVVKGDEGQSDGIAATVAATAGGTVAGVAAGAAAMAAGVPTSIQNAISSMTGGKTGSAEEPTEPAAAVPEQVKHAQEAAHATPEASGNAEAVSEKTQVEKELLNKVPRTDEASEPAPTVSATQSATAPGAAPSAFSKDPTIADESTAAAIAAVNAGPAAPAAAFQGDPVAVGQTGKAGDSGLNASAQQPAKTAGTEATSASQTTTPAGKAAGGAANDGGRVDSRDVSPMSKPAVTSGVESKQAASRQEGSQASASGSPAQETPTDKKSKRRSFFGKIKDKLKS